MLELSRVRLHSIGPRGARFSDVLLDFSGVGPPVAGPRQDGLFGADGTRPRRPSPASVLFLENGGGKSVLMKLIFSVVLPGRRHVVGTSNGRVLDNFVLPRDSGHVACEWQHAVTGERVVTGKVSEWRGRPGGGAEPPRLAEAWYSFRPRGGMDLASLPLAQDGRLVTLSGFRDRLSAAQAADASLDVVWETSQAAWNDRLDSIGLDPELFRYQRAMNAGEGEAADAFAFASDEQFVDFLLRAVTTPEDPAGLTEVVDGYAGKLAERATLTAEREFVAGAIDRLGPLVESVRRRTDAEHALTASRGELAALAMSVHTHVDNERAGGAGLAVERDAAAQAEADRETDRARAADAVVAARRRIAELRLAGAEGERDRLVEAQRDAATTVEAWRATDDVLRLAAASAEAERLTRLVADAESNAAPALADRDAAARALVAGLLALARASEADAAEAEREAAAHEERAAAASAAERRCADEAATARARMQALADRADSDRQVRDQAVRDGLLPDATADVRELADEARRAADQACTAVRDALATVVRLDGERQASAEATRAAERAVDRAEAVLRGVEQARREAADAAAALTADGRIAALLDLDQTTPGKTAALAAPGETAAPGAPGAPGETGESSAQAGAAANRPAVPGVTVDVGDFDVARPVGLVDLVDVDLVDLDVYAEAALSALGRAVAAADQQRLELSVADDDDRRVLAALGEGNLLPAREEVTATLGVLEAAGVAAVAGWKYLAHVVDEQERETVLAAHPELVDGVVLTDPTSLPRAREALAAARLLPRAVVAVGGVSSLLDLANPVADGDRVFLVQPNPALYNAEAAEAERLAIRARQGERQQASAVLSARADADRALAAAVTAWRRTYPPGRLAILAAEADAAATTLATAMDELAQAHRVNADLAAAGNAALATVTTLRAAEQAAHARASVLDQLASALSDRGDRGGDLGGDQADQWDDPLHGGAFADEAARASAEADRHRATAQAERHAAQEALRRADAARRNAETARSETASVVGAGEVRACGDGPDAAGGPAAARSRRSRATGGTSHQTTVGDGESDDGEGDDGGDLGRSVPVAVLRADYEAASRTYTQVEVGADVRGDVDRARRAEADARAATDGLPADVRARAQSLLAGTSGGDATARSAGEAEARRRLASVGEQSDAARERVGGLREELRQVTEEARRRGIRPVRGADLDGAATDIEGADELLRRARDEVSRAEASVAAARTRTERLTELVRRQQVDLEAFRGVAETLADAVAETGRPAVAAPRAGGTAAAAATATVDAETGADVPQPVGTTPVKTAPFSGDVEAAREASRRLRTAWRDASTRVAEASSEVRVAVDAVVAWAGQDRFEQVRAPARRQMIRAGRDAVAANAPEWAQALAPRLRSLDDDLAHIGRNRAAIVARLEGMVRGALGTLRAAARLSRLPDQLGDWSGQEFLRISFAEPDPAALTEALGEVVDSVATATATVAIPTGASAEEGARAGAETGAGGAGGAGATAVRPNALGPTGRRRAGTAGGAGRRDGMSLLLRGVRAALPNGIKIEILKPDAVLRTERVRVSQMSDVFSGGQQLTAAIILYCTMAALRANDRGQLRTPHAGVLFLDNPIGRASAAYLLDLQLAVAERLGVQLVYTTGLFDTSALASFPLVVRLRNDADLRAGLKYLRVEEHLRPALTPSDPGPDAGPSAGVVTATRLFTRHVTPVPPQPPHATDSDDGSDDGSGSGSGEQSRATPNATEPEPAPAR